MVSVSVYETQMPSVQSLVGVVIDFCQPLVNVCVGGFLSPSFDMNNQERPIGLVYNYYIIDFWH